MANKDVQKEMARLDKINGYNYLNKTYDNIWQELADKLPHRKNDEDKVKREKLWSYVDTNGNGIASLAEIDKAMRDFIRIPILFQLKPVLMRAFTKAKNMSHKKEGAGLSDDYVTLSEFRYLLVYLRQYYEYWVAFERLDVDNDHKIGYKEFVKGLKMMSNWGIDISDPKALWKEADSDNGGQILFNEFVDWAISKNLDLEDDDNEV